MKLTIRSLMAMLLSSVDIFIGERRAGHRNDLVAGSGIVFEIKHDEVGRLLQVFMTTNAPHGGRASINITKN